MTQHSEVIDKWYNPVHGMELEPSINMGARGNENGVVFWATYIFLANLLNKIPSLEIERERFRLLVSDLRHKGIKGLYNRGAGEDNIPTDKKRTISHDNISAISSLGVILDCPEICKEIWEYGKKHFFVFNNTGKKFMLPMNPANYAVWGFNAGSKFWWLTSWLYVINLLITLSKPKQDTSSKLLHFIKIAPIAHKNKFWSALMHIWNARINQQYGSLEALTTIYYKNPNHPNNVLAKEVDIIMQKVQEYLDKYNT